MLMKNSNWETTNEYYHNLTNSRVSSKTSRRLKSIHKCSQISDNKTRFFNRIEKACTTNSQEHLAKELHLYRKQIQRLEKELLKKDKVIIDAKSTSSQNKTLEVELIQVYRIVYLYEGKISQYEKELKRLEILVSEKAPSQQQKQVEELLQSYRIENGELQANLQERNRIIFQLQDKIKVMENKYFNASWKLCSSKRQNNNPLKKRFPNLKNSINSNQMTLLQRQKYLKMKMKTTSTTSNDYQLMNKQGQNNQDNQNTRQRHHEDRVQRTEGLVLKNINQISNIQSQQNIHLLGHSVKPAIKHNNQSVDERPIHPSSDRKIYISPIHRYELNRHSQQIQTDYSSQRLELSTPHRQTNLTNTYKQ